MSHHFRDISTHCPRCMTQASPLEDLAFCPQCRFPMRLIAKKYRIFKRLATGGFGVIYLALHLEKNETYVVKILKPDVFDYEDTPVRFAREIRLTDQLSRYSPHFVSYYEQGEDPDLGRYYVMEFLRGQTIAQRLDTGLPMSYRDIFHIFQQLCTAMQQAHYLSVIHRDLKPNNIFLTSQNNDHLFVKMLDLGLAKSLTGTANEGLTRDAVGTPQYMAPEQCLNEPVDARTDIYAMGIILYELLTGHLPFDDNRSTIELLRAQLSTPPPSLSTKRPDLALPEGLDDAVRKALAKKPAERYQDSLSFWEAVAPFASMKGGVSYPESTCLNAPGVAAEAPTLKVHLRPSYAVVDPQT